MFSRRLFLASSIAAPVLYSRSFGMSANEKIQLGFIGVGTMGRGHLGGFLGMNDVEVVAVCDVVKERLDSAAQMVNKQVANRSKSGLDKTCTKYTDFRKLLEHPGLDAVVIATPDHWHAMPCILAARAKKHIYCEKPLTHNVAEGRAIVNAVKQAGITFQTGSQQRSEFNNYFRRAVEEIWNGRIGKIHTIRIGVGSAAQPCRLPTQEVPAGTDWDSWLGPAPERGFHEELCPKGVHGHFPAWRNYREYAGGALADMGAHHFDIAQWALNMDNSGPVEILPPEQSDAGLRFTYANGVVMYHNMFEGTDRADCVFEGSEGKIFVSRGGFSKKGGIGGDAALTKDAKRVMPSRDHKRNWVEAIRMSQQSTICPAEVGHRTATICHLGNIGYNLRRKLTWDPVAEKFVGDEAANKLLTREPRAKWQLV